MINTVADVDVVGRTAPCRGEDQLRRLRRTDVVAGDKAVDGRRQAAPPQHRLLIAAPAVGEDDDAPAGGAQGVELPGRIVVQDRRRTRRSVMIKALQQIERGDQAQLGEAGVDD
jgi:hypothetical protein